MTAAEGEDMLLSLMRFYQREKTGPMAEDLISLSVVSDQNVIFILNDLIQAGEVVRKDGRYYLTDMGVNKAEIVMRRHRVLETFLQEMLGMDHEQAHAQACTMEHHTNDDTIKRLRSFLRTNRDCRDGYGVCKDPDNHYNCKCLTECKTGEKVIVSVIRGCGRAVRLADLGLVPGEEIIIKQRMDETMLIQVKGCDIAISPEIARSVLVEVPV